MRFRAVMFLYVLLAMGGMVRAIEQHYPQAEIEQSSYRYQQEIERGERPGLTK